MQVNWKKSNTLQKRAQKILPLGVNSNFRYLGRRDHTIFIESKGSVLVGCGWE